MYKFNSKISDSDAHDLVLSQVLGPTHWWSRWEEVPLWPGSPTHQVHFPTHCSVSCHMNTTCCGTLSSVSVLDYRISQYHLYNMEYHIAFMTYYFVSIFIYLYFRSSIPKRITRTTGSHVSCTSAAGHAGSVSRVTETGTGAAVATWARTPARCSSP